MANIEVPLLYNEYRYRALEKAINEAGGDLQMGLRNKLDQMYHAFVPPKEQERVEAMIQKEYDYAQKHSCAYGVFHFHNDDGDMHIATPLYNSLFQFGRLYEGHLRSSAYSYSIDSIACLFAQHKEIDPELFQSLCDTFHSNDSVSIIADVDFERGYISVLDKDADDWHTYSLDDINEAVYAVYEKPDIPEYERLELFENALSGKQIDMAETPSEDASLTPQQ